MKKLSEIFAGFGSKNEPRETHSCCSGGRHTLQNENSDSNAKYFCPMKCEGNKTYNEPGKCPVCNMYLVLVGEKQSHQH